MLNEKEKDKWYNEKNMENTLDLDILGFEL